MMENGRVFWTQDLSIAFGGLVAVDHVDIDVSRGEILGLIGPNGCGKSTMIRALSRIISPFSGRILIDGQDITRLSRQQLAHLIGVVPQMPILPSAFTAFEIVLMGRNPHLGLLQYEGKKDTAIAWQAMEETSTHNLANRKIGQLSGGEIQSIVIARVLAQQTKGILLDEPTANLDIGRQIEILDLIKGLCLKDNLTVVIAMHELNLATQYCDRLVLIDKGRIQCQGEPREVITEENISQVYGSSNYIEPHPLSGLPVVLPTAGSSKKKV